MTDAQRRIAVAATAVLLVATGAGFLFAGDVLGARLFAAPVPPPLASLLGVALIAFGLMNWTAKGSALGGIYGRAILVGNQTHFLGGTLILLTSADVSRDSPAFWAIVAVYALGTAVFTYLTFGPGPRPRT